MATTESPSTAAGFTPEGIAKSGEGLIRLWVAAFTLPITVGNAVGTSFTSLVSSATAVLDGQPAAQSSNELVKATGELANATGKLFTTLISSATGLLEGVARAINEAVAPKGPAR